MQNKMKNREVGGYREVKMKSLQESENIIFSDSCRIRKYKKHDL